MYTWCILLKRYSELQNGCHAEKNEHEYCTFVTKERSLLRKIHDLTLSKTLFVFKTLYNYVCGTSRHTSTLTHKVSAVITPRVHTMYILNVNSKLQSPCTSNSIPVI